MADDRSVGLSSASPRDGGSGADRRLEWIAQQLQSYFVGGGGRIGGGAAGRMEKFGRFISSSEYASTVQAFITRSDASARVLVVKEKQRRRRGGTRGLPVAGKLAASPVDGAADAETRPSGGRKGRGGGGDGGSSAVASQQWLSISLVCSANSLRGRAMYFAKLAPEVRRV
jgi:hypothetical protein